MYQENISALPGLYNILHEDLTFDYMIFHCFSNSIIQVTMAKKIFYVNCNTLKKAHYTSSMKKSCAVNNSCCNQLTKNEKKKIKFDIYFQQIDL